MNIITAQLQPLAKILGETPVPKDEFVKKAHEACKKKGIVNLLQMIEFRLAYRVGDEIVLN